MILGRLAVGATAAWAAYTWGAHLVTPGCVWRGPATRRRIALTFDDGPDPIWSERILDLLARREVRASFFLVGERAAQAPETVRRIAAADHEIASHGWSHRSLWLCGPRRTEAEIGRAHRLLSDASGRSLRHFRPPWGMVNAAMFGALRRHGERCVFWSIQPERLRPAPAAQQARDVLRRAHPGAIVDLHDAEGVRGAPGRLLTALPLMIDGLREAGYDFATMSTRERRGDRAAEVCGRGRGTTRRAFAAPVRLGSIRARCVRRRVEGTGPVAPYHTSPPPCCPGARGHKFEDGTDGARASPTSDGARGSVGTRVPRPGAAGTARRPAPSP